MERTKTVECRDIVYDVPAESDDLCTDERPADTDICPATALCGYCINTAKRNARCDPKFGLNSITNEDQCAGLGLTFSWCPEIANRDCEIEWGQCTSDCDRPMLNMIPPLGTGAPCDTEP
eukprot:UN34326